MSPKVSIIIPVYNVENYLRPCIESALAQTLKDIEVIIVDDGSTDSSVDIIDYYARQDDRVIAIHKPNEGYGKACNVGFDTAKGEYVAILESDDFVDADMYESLYNYAKSLDADVVKSPYKDVFLKDAIKPYPHNDFLTRNMPRGRLYSIAECPCQLVTHQSIWAGIYRTSYMREKGIRFLEVPGAGHVDIKFCVESLIQSDKLAWLDHPFYDYRVEREGSSTANYSITENAKRYREMHDYFLAYDEGLFRKAAPSLVARECYGLFRYFKKCSYDHADEEIVQSLMQDFTVEEIKRAPLISAADKEELIRFRDSGAVAKPAQKAAKKAPAAGIPRKVVVSYAGALLLAMLMVVELLLGLSGVLPTSFVTILFVVTLLPFMAVLLYVARWVLQKALKA